MADNSFQGTIETLFRGMDQFVTTKTVVGDAITVGDTIVLPLVDVTFGMAASTKAEDKKNNGGGGLGGKISPSAVLLIQNGTTRLVNVKNQDGVTKVIDMMPDLVNRFMPGSRNAKDENAGQKQKVDDAVNEASKEQTF